MKYTTKGAVALLVVFLLTLYVVVGDPNRFESILFGLNAGIALWIFVNVTFDAE